VARLAQTTGLTDIQIEILQTVKEFVDKQIIPSAQALEHADEYPPKSLCPTAAWSPVSNRTPTT
jgi:hypothetical protein